MLLWAAEGRLLTPEREVIVSEAEAVLISAATIWEVEIKRALGRLDAPDDLIERSRDAGFDGLAISLVHAQHAGRLPRLHADPFDRMLIAQAQVDGLTLATADAEIARYDVPILSISTP